MISIVKYLTEIDAETAFQAARTMARTRADSVGEDPIRHVEALNKVKAFTAARTPIANQSDSQVIGGLQNRQNMFAKLAPRQ